MLIDPIRPRQSFTASTSNPGPRETEHAQIAAVGLPNAPLDLNPIGVASPMLTVIVPTRDEKDNIERLLARLGPAVTPLDAEVIIVDDSDDETPQVLADKAGDCAVPVRLLHRPPGFRQGGLGSAVIAGARHARGDWVLVMDADLQHPPEIAAVLASTAMRHDCDIVMGTRYASDGSAADGLGSAGRVFVSSYATRLVKNLFPRRLAMVSDPLSGLFAFRRTSVNLDRLRPTGFKVLLEILVRNPVARVAEVTYHFEPRAAGDSKASLLQGVTFLRHLVRLRAARLARQLRERPVTSGGRISQAVRFVSFGLIGATGIVVNSAALWFFYHTLGWNHLIGAALATQVSTTWNFVLVDTVIYRNRAHGTRLGRAVRFFLMNNILLLARLPVLQLLIDRGLPILVANGITLMLLFVVRFVLSDRAIFAPATQETRRDPVRVLVDLAAPDGGGPGSPSPASRKRSRYLTYRYDVAGVVKIGSQVMLPELEFFRAQWIADGDVDIAVRVGDVGNKRPRRRAAMIESPDPTVIRYEEHLGRFGANFRASIDERITVDVGPLLARSSHVVYTNILEPLLRFVMVSRGRMLLHSACVELAGTGVMLSALTDTGKTGTVLRLLREHGGRFLSDDMTVIDHSGNASWFPKPLTISAHTLRSVSADDLTRSEWRRLQIQSRLHSKGGRSIGMALSRFNLPIMGINAVTQILVPPPKYTVDRLVPCLMADATRVRELFIIERGSPRLADLDRHDALTRLLANTDDAYGFPPFRYLAPAISIGSQDYRELRAAERDILAGFLGNVRVRTLASDSFGWADEIPRLIQASDSPGPSRDESQASPTRSGSSPVQRNGAACEGNGMTPRGDRERAGGATVVPAGVGIPHAGNGSGPAPSPAPSPAMAPPQPAMPRPARRSVRGRLLYPGLPLAAVMALSVVLRFWQLAAVGFNSDEAVYTGSAASIAGNPTLAAVFPVFRAHPLLFQTLLSLVLRIDDTDWTARAFAAAIGVMTVGVTFLLGRRLYGNAAGLLAAVLLAVMPYHVVVSRQVLLDGLMTLCATAALYCVVRYVETERLSWLLACGSTMSAAILAKETSVVLLGGLYVFFALTPLARLRAKQLWLMLLLITAEVAIWPLMLRLAGHTHTGQSYLVWQLFRRPNHGTWFYFTVLPGWLGPAVLGAAIAGLIWLRREASWRERLLLAWLVVPVLFFTLWPVKGFQYLLPIAPALAILAGRTLARPLPLPRLRQLPLPRLRRRTAEAPSASDAPSGASADGHSGPPADGKRHARLRLAGRLAMGTLAVATAVSAAVPAWARIQPSTSVAFLAGSGGMTGGREAGTWILQHAPQGSRLLAIGPSVANVLEFYGRHQVSALSVSTNPHDRNPSYAPVINPDLDLRNGEFQYIVWDAYTAAHSRFFAAEALRLVRKFHGAPVYASPGTVRSPARPGTVEPAIAIYEVHP
jgi:dolichol-phosphate mannosyltransferase